MKIIPITQWSISKAKTFGQCKLRAQLQYGQKIPEPERPLPPGKTEHANDRGSRIHDEAENYVKGQGPFGREMGKFQAEFDSLQKLYKDGMVSTEGEWAMDSNWEPVEWRAKEAWLRLKLDAIVHLSEYEAVIIDYKSGKKFGNEVSHAEQVQLYQLVSFLRYPKLELIHTELWYLDVDDLTQNTFTRQQGLRFKHNFTKKGFAMTECTEFPASPNIFNCKWCPYGPSGTGHCERGV
ncbi:PD-(D/E)XK nuclease family protein [Herminiimonas sp. CN]|uniref:PD-(D/E)XK nuclease family protein n=1 Tax=Herminiimonas sp. CN TaxID=1349818 RepID=UPI000473AC91|nr:PD-(D/E)XK nuclease family protein [Herminiimonas sp. CN]